MEEGARETVLVVDDDRAIRHVLRAALERLDFLVVESVDGAEALEVFDADSHMVSAVVSDIGMPRLDGIGLVEGLEHRAVSVPVILTSGARSQESLPNAVRSRISGFVPKPYTLDAIITAVTDAIAGRRDARV